MHRGFLKLYNNELHHLRHMAAEFARDFPKIAGRLALDTDAKEACPDPFVERLLEGFAFLTARVQLKLEAEFPLFTQSLLETIYPHFLCPTPSMAVVRMESNRKDPGGPDGFKIPRGSSMRSSSSEGQTPCEFRTAHEVHLWPLQVIEAQYYTRDLAQLELPSGTPKKAALRIRLQTLAGLKLKALKNFDRLPFHVRGLDETPVSVFEQIFSRTAQVVIKTTKTDGDLSFTLPADSIQRMGLAENEALLPFAPRGFEGYRLLQEYFALPQRFLFFQFTGLGKIFSQLNCDKVDLILVLKEAHPPLENRVEADTFQLHCTPVVNLFPKRLDPISLLDRFSEFHAVPERTRPTDFEIYHVEEVVGHGTSNAEPQVFQPFYRATDRDLDSAAYYSTHRVPRKLSTRELKSGSSSYSGSEVFLSLVDAHNAPYRSDLQQLGLLALCTNRHLPIQMATGVGKTDFTLDLYAPVSAVRCLSGPTEPLPPHTEGEETWKVISHLALNYLSIIPDSADGGAGALGEILKLYCDSHDTRNRKQIDGIRAVTSTGIVRRIETPGPLTFARGLEIAVLFDEENFEGTGCFILGSVLERFFARYVSLNSFTETVVRSTKRGEIIRWAAQPGKKQII